MSGPRRARSLRARLMGGFGLVALLLVTSGALLERELVRVREASASFEDNLREVEAAKDLQLQVANVWQFLTDAALTKEDEPIREAEAAFALANADFDTLAALNRDDVRHLAAIEAARGTLPEMLELGKRMARAYESDQAQGDALMVEYDRVCGRVIERVAEFAGKVVADSRAAHDVNEAAIDRLAWGAAVTVLGLIALLALIARGTAASIAAPLAEVVAWARQLASGDLTHALEIRTDDELGAMTKALDETLVGIRAALGTDRVHWADVAATRQRLDLVQRLVDGAPLPIIHADRDGIVRFVNPAGVRALRAIEAHLPIRAEAVVGARVELLVGAAALAGIERESVSAEARRSRITFGDTHVEQAINAVRDRAGDFAGTTITWDVVTARVASEARVGAERITALSSEVGAAATQLAHLADELERASARVTTSIDDASSEASSLAAAAEEIGRAVQSTAASSAELAGRIDEVAKRATETSAVAKTAADAADRSKATIAELGASSSEVGQVAKVIGTIAEQTNLLALNATIEAARAGAAGKGFAVVATEVKELASQTAKATEDVGRRVTAIQADTRATSDVIAEVATVIRQIDDASASIVDAVERQVASTRALGAELASTESSARLMTKRITRLAEATGAASASVASTASVAADVRALADALAALGGTRVGNTHASAPAARAATTSVMHAPRPSPAPVARR